MKRHFFSSTLMAALFMATFTSCDTAVLTEEYPAGTIAINLNADIKPSSTYAVNGQWETSDEVGFFMKRTGQPLTGFGAVYSNADNVRMSIAGQRLTSSPPVMYPTSGNVDFVAYYPYSSISQGYTIPVNIAGQDSVMPVEILYSSNITGQAPTESPVTLNFNYSLAKIELTVAGGVNSGLDAADFSALTVTVEDIYTQATFQLADGTFTNYREKQPVMLHKKNVNATSASFEAVVLPTNEELTFLFDLDGAVYRHKMTVNYAADTLYRYNFSLDFPAFSMDSASLLNAVIVPRGEAPQENIPVDASLQMTMTTEAPEVEFRVFGTGKVSIDWGDGTPSETHTLGDVSFAYMPEGNGASYRYSYAGTSTRIITVAGENIMSLICFGIQLTELDVSKNTVLTQLQCMDNRLTELDVSNNKALRFLDCSINQFSTNGLNKLFGTLHSNTFPFNHPKFADKKVISIILNPGTDTCDRSIAENKGWMIEN